MQVVNFHRRVPANGDTPAGVVSQLALVAREAADGSVTLIAINQENTDAIGSPDFHLALLRRVGVLPAEHQDVADGKATEWFTVEEPVAAPVDGFYVPLADVLDLSVAVINNGGSDLAVSPDATVKSAVIVINRLAEKAKTDQPSPDVNTSDEAEAAAAVVPDASDYFSAKD